MNSTVNTFILFLAIFGSVRAFVIEEILDAFCSTPQHLFKRYLNCTLNESPELFRKASDIVYNCVDEYFENDGKLEGFVLFLCDKYVQDDEDVKSCLQRKENFIPNPKEEEVMEMLKYAVYCMMYA
ncbi:venom protein 7.1-like [Centruroides sculpturatus]|uniref:venom protein 7.1-like n=1 Tax=Centruroides sculpturatus TaxID=218467 RepID=UPI000C6EAF06|nr:venom protein 7.1-like [Centruroides sculpturatus]